MKTENNIKMLEEMLKKASTPQMKKNIEGKIKALLDNKDIKK